MTNKQIRDKKIKFELTINELEYVLSGIDSLLDRDGSIVLTNTEIQETKELKFRVFQKLYKEFK